MTMRTAVAIVALAGALALAGCGVPDSSAPILVGPAPAAGDPVTGTGTARLPDRDGATSAMDLVTRFVQAGAAANWDPDREEANRIQEATTWAGQFLAPDLRREYRPSVGVLVVDAQFEEDPDDRVRAILTPIGTLEATGVLSLPPQSATSVITAQFQATTVNGILLLTMAEGSQLPNFLLLSSAGLQELFEERPVYYWDKADRFLVPDRRYVSKGISDEKRVRAIINQLFAGPSTFLGDFVHAQSRTTLDNPELNGNRIRVNLAPAGQEADQVEALRSLARQIRWSVHKPSSTPDVEIQIAGRFQLVDTGTEFLPYNPSQPRANQTAAGEDRLFAVHDGRVVAVSPTAAIPSILDEPENSGVVLAAVNRQNNAAALVRRVAGNLELRIGSGTDPAFQRVVFAESRPTTMSRPSYIANSGGRLLIAVDGNLYDVAADGRTAGKITLPSGDVTAVSVAPDGSRVALVTQGRTVVAPLDASGPLATVGGYRAVATPGVTGAVGVGWLYEDELVVIGPAWMVNVTIDNGRAARITLANLGNAELTQVSATSGNPFDGIHGVAVVQAGPAGQQAQAYYAYGSGLATFPAPAGASPSASPSVATSAGPGTTPPAVRLTAPFYVDDIK